ncbi:hypothetical protein K788_0008594 [Paraburkholderia caribensis MBA4]|uniref:Uncharacterized protein n=1 Tax=Paraburkholderia caribensis MBA4 TaxID=1323664 RepID=A0A0P0RFE0_9BURK|nr:hypothetical protein K788_0008594 [Paraburkholderia caribensis MBA4]
MTHFSRQSPSLTVLYTNCHSAINDNFLLPLSRLKSGRANAPLS